MKYDIKPKPTTYNGRLYRSRLEARWAAFFDILGWEYEYEPFDLDGWSPDFAIKCKYPKSDSQVACKKEYLPTKEDDPLAFDFKCVCGHSKINDVETGTYNNCYKYSSNEIIEQVCLVEIKPINEFQQEVADKIDRANKGQYEILLLGLTPLIDKGYGQFGWLYENKLKWDFGWGDAIFTGTIGFAHGSGSFGCRIEGSGGGSDHHLQYNVNTIIEAWTAAANRVMFLNPIEKNNEIIVEENDHAHTYALMMRYMSDKDFRKGVDKLYKRVVNG